jgi:hypothetical protein
MQKLKRFGYKINITRNSSAFSELSWLPPHTMAHEEERQRHN